MNQLVIFLTPLRPNEQFHSFVSTFLLTYDLFTTPDILLQKLIERYNVPVDNSKTQEENDLERTSIQLRVINAIKLWLESRFSQLSDRILNSIQDFINEVVVVTQSFHGNALLQNLATRVLFRKLLILD